MSLVASTVSVTAMVVGLMFLASPDVFLPILDGLSPQARGAPLSQCAIDTERLIEQSFYDPTTRRAGVALREAEEALRERRNEHLHPSTAAPGGRNTAGAQPTPAQLAAIAAAEEAVEAAKRKAQQQADRVGLAARRLPDVCYKEAVAKRNVSAVSELTPLGIASLQVSVFGQTFVGAVRAWTKDWKKAFEQLTSDSHNVLESSLTLGSYYKGCCGATKETTAQLKTYQQHLRYLATVTAFCFVSVCLYAIVLFCAPAIIFYYLGHQLIFGVWVRAFVEEFVGRLSKEGVLASDSRLLRLPIDDPVVGVSLLAFAGLWFAIAMVTAMLCLPWMVLVANVSDTWEENATPKATDAATVAAASRLIPLLPKDSDEDRDESTEEEQDSTPARSPSPPGAARPAATATANTTVRKRK